MDLKEIREAYFEILSAWNILFPIFTEARRREKEEITDSVDIEGESFYLTTMGKLRRAHREIKKEADASGGAKIWTAEEYSQEFLKSLITQR